MPFLTPLNVSLAGTEDNGDARWILDTALVYESEAAKRTITVPAGFVTDFASVPRLPVAFLLTADTAHEAAVVHDCLYSSHLLPRDVADAVFLDAMKATGVSWWRRSLMWLGVRAFGGTFYDRKQEQDEHAA